MAGLGAMVQPAAAPAVETGSAREDRDVLLRFYRTTHGESWTDKDGWEEDAPDLGSWHGVTTNTDGRVIKLELGERHTSRRFFRDSNIDGAIPEELGRLGALKSLMLISSELSGMIPPALGRLGALEKFELTGSKLIGSIPEELDGLSSLKELRLGPCGLSGALPAALWRLGSLEKLGLTGVKVTGTIPEELDGLSLMKELRLSSCGLSGALPAALWRLGALETLQLSWLKLTGTIPEELDGLSLLKELTLSSCGLSGALPAALWRLGALERLVLTGVKVTGTIPEELDGLSSLKELTLHSCGLSGALPAALWRLGALEKLVLVDMKLTGTIPEELDGLSSLKELTLSHCGLSGALPAALWRLGALETLQLSRLKLTGTIPEELGGLSSLKELTLSSCGLSGALPAALWRLGALEKLGLTGVKVTGTISEELDGLSSLKELRLSSCGLSGTIPPEFGHLGAVERLDLSSNNLTGALPPELGRLGALKSLDVSNNNLTGFGTTESALRLVKRFRALEPNAFGVSNNPWVMPPEGVVEKGVPAIEKYLLDVRKAEDAGAPAKVVQLLKVVLVGSSQAGKTSLVTSMVRRTGTRTTGEARDVSTKGIELHRHQIMGTTVEFYDCAGQVDYYGMHQTFLTRRALYLLVWDVKKCYGKAGEALDEVVREDIMRWLFALHLRAPGCSVILIANKCDGSIEDFAATAERVEERARELLKIWQEDRKIPGMTEVALLPHPSRVSCDDGGGLSEVIDRVAAHGATSASVPPSWGLAIAFLDALREKRAPLPAARKYLGLEARSEEADEDSSPSLYMTKAALLERWKGVVQGVTGELRSEVERMAVSDPESALEGAVWISESAGQLLVVDDGGFIYLDVGWLTYVLKPILDHTLEDRPVPYHLGKMRDELNRNGLLRLEFARYLWSRVMKTEISDGLFDALCRVIVDLGIALPLEASSVSAEGSLDSTGQSHRRFRDMLVIMRLSESCEPQQERDLGKLISEMTDRHERKVTFKWKFDSAGPPYGLIERVIASCHVAGTVKMGLCWRYGAVFNSHAMATDGGPYRLYTFVIRYDATFCDDRRTLSLRMFGPLGDDRVWAALRWVASSVVNLSKKWRGVLWDGWPQCALHPLERTYLATADKAGVGDLLLPGAAPGMFATSCDCHRVNGTVLRLILERLGPIIDTRAGTSVERSSKELREDRGRKVEEETFEEKSEEKIGISSPSGVLEVNRRDEPEDSDGVSEGKVEETFGISSSNGAPEVIIESEGSEGESEVKTEDQPEQRLGDEPPASGCCRKALSKWRPYAWQTATALGVAAVTLFSVYTGALGTEGALWEVCVGIVMVLLFGAGAALVVFIHDFFCVNDEEEQRDGSSPDAGVP